MFLVTLFWLGVIFGIWSLILVGFRGYKNAQWGMKHNTPPPDQFNFSLPFIVTIICWVVVICIKFYS
jgi:hypothetical protein